MVNEKREKAKRYAKFDVDALCNIVASIPDISSPICKIEKLEGGFDKALLMTAQNQKQVVAKVPCPNVVPPVYCTASEVALLEYGNALPSCFLADIYAGPCGSFNANGTV